MFSGLNKLIKLVLPKRLFYRALIIVAAPTIILQVIITIVFYDSIWIKANKNITRSLVAQLKAIEEVYQNRKDQLGQILTLLKKTKRIQLNGIEIEDPDIVKGITIGISIANNIMGEFPAQVCNASEVYGNEEE